MGNNQNTNIETDYYDFLTRVLVNPNLLKGNSGELQAVLNKLLLLYDVNQLKEIRNRTFSMLKLSPPPFTNSFIAVQEIRRVIIELSQSNQVTTMNIVREIANDTYASRIKTSDKQAKAVSDFVKG